MASGQQEMKWALNHEWGTEEASGEESPDGANKVPTLPTALLSAEEAGQTRSSKGRRAWPDRVMFAFQSGLPI